MSRELLDIGSTERFRIAGRGSVRRRFHQLIIGLLSCLMCQFIIEWHGGILTPGDERHLKTNSLSGDGGKSGFWDDDIERARFGDLHAEEPLIKARESNFTDRQPLIGIIEGIEAHLSIKSSVIN